MRSRGRTGSRTGGAGGRGLGSGGGEPPPGLARVGRPPRTIPAEERALILRAEDEERLHAVALERAIERYRGIHIPHNRIWRVLKEAGRVRDEPRKQQRRGGGGGGGGGGGAPPRRGSSARPDRPHPPPPPPPRGG